jgi:hypothetical protein
MHPIHPTLLAAEKDKKRKEKKRKEVKARRNPITLPKVVDPSVRPSIRSCFH